MSRSDYVKHSVFDKIYLAMQYENVLAVQVSLETGARIGDVVALRSENLSKNTITYVAAKTLKTDKKSITPQLAERLRRNAGGGWLFPSRRSESGHRTRQAVWKDIRQACAHFGITGNISPHSARKTYAVTDYHAHGLNRAQKDLQHDNLNTTMLYVFSDQLQQHATCENNNNSHVTCELCAQCERIAESLAHRVIDIVSLHFQESKLN